MLYIYQFLATLCIMACWEHTIPPTLLLFLRGTPSLHLHVFMHDYATWCIPSSFCLHAVIIPLSSCFRQSNHNHLVWFNIRYIKMEKIHFIAILFYYINSSTGVVQVLIHLRTPKACTFLLFVLFLVHDKICVVYK